MPTILGDGVIARAVVIVLSNLPIGHCADQGLHVLLAAMDPEPISRTCRGPPEEASRLTSSLSW
eukprot:4314679-Pyramimonas_sp.AAC.1